MTKRIDSPLKQVEETNGAPRAFRWRGRRVMVDEVLEEWEETGCWWRGEPALRVYRVQAAGGAIYELHHQPPGGWRLYRGFD